MLLQVNNATKEFSGEALFENLHFEIKGTEKVAIIGRNGCGKSTLLKIIADVLPLDKGEIVKSDKTTIGYLSQQAFEDETLTVQQEFDKVFKDVIELKEKMDNLAEKMAEDYENEALLTEYANLQHLFEAKNGYNYNQRQIMLFTRFGFEMADLNRMLNTFSGGQKTRIAFVKLLLLEPDILLLDEPTNHLDMETIMWLEDYLNKYPKAIVVVSHDRMFMDKVVSEIYEFEFGRLNHYVANYSKYTELKKQEFEKMQSAYRRQQLEVAKLQQQIEKFRYKKNKAAFAQSKIKYLSRLTLLEKPREDLRKMSVHFDAATKGGASVLQVEDMVIGYDKPLCKIGFELRNGNKLAVIGPNGQGKSTFLKTIIGELEPLSGNYLYGHQIEIAYFDQQLAQFQSDKTVLEELWDEYPEYDHTQIRKILGQFLFTADDVYKSCNVLSGGEKVRLSLCKIMLSKANLLILDEPTNHLDIAGKEALEQALSEYTGSVLFVSHDRYFVRKLADSILYINKEQTKYYSLNYDEYMEKTTGVQTNEKKEVKPAIVDEKKELSSKDQRERNKKAASLERQIAKAEEELEALRALRDDEEYYHDYRKLNELEEQIDEKHNEIFHLMEQWEEYAS